MREQTAEYYYPNIMGRIMLRALEEILGNSGLNAVLNHSRLSQLIQKYPPSDLNREIPYIDISQIMASLEEIYGERGGQGLAMRSGRACFKYGLREFSQLNILTDKNFRLLPLNTKIREGAKILANTFNEYIDQRVWVSEDEIHFYWHMDNCPLCWQRHTNRPVCHLAVGTLQEALFWVSGGKFYNVEETLCIAKGDPTCRLRVDKAPFE
jgi:hypothetical protein